MREEIGKQYEKRPGLRGTDWSHHQRIELDSDINDYDFFIHKLTEGRFYRDPYCRDRVLRHCANKPCIVYHFMRTDTATGLENWENFSQNINLFIGCFVGLAIDLETDAKGQYTPLTPESKSRVKEFAQLFAARFPGASLIVYTGADGWKYFKDCFKGIKVVPWIARWSEKEPTVKEWKIWQFSSHPYDLDVFKGEMDELVKILTHIH